MGDDRHACGVKRLRQKLQDGSGQNPKHAKNPKLPFDFHDALFLHCGFVQKQQGRDLLTPQLRHWYAFNGTLSGTPEWACPESRPLSEITSFELDSSRSRKSVVGLVIT